MTETVKSSRPRDFVNPETSTSHPERDRTQLKVLVLAGGNSAERDVSLTTGQAVYDALQRAGHKVIGFDPAGGNTTIAYNKPLIADGIKSDPPDVGYVQEHPDPPMNPAQLGLSELRDVDVVFIALHGGDGENGRLQALLDSAGVVYTGSGMAASALAMDKHSSKRIFKAEEIPTPRWHYIPQGHIPSERDYAGIRSEFELPLIVKPNCQGSTVGLTLVKELNQLPEAVARAARYAGGVLIEEYIPGREITVAVLEEEPLPVVEIIPQSGLYDYASKYTKGRSQYTCPADLPSELTREAQRIGLHVFKALGCSGYARVDYRLSPEGKLYCLELNTLPGMTSLSLVPMAAKAAGITFDELLERICKSAIVIHNKPA